MTSRDHQPNQIQSNTKTFCKFTKMFLDSVLVGTLAEVRGLGMSATTNGEPRLGKQESLGHNNDFGAQPSPVCDKGVAAISAEDCLSGFVRDRRSPTNLAIDENPEPLPSIVRQGKFLDEQKLQSEPVRRSPELQRQLPILRRSAGCRTSGARIRSKTPPPPGTTKPASEQTHQMVDDGGNDDSPLRCREMLEQVAEFGAKSAAVPNVVGTLGLTARNMGTTNKVISSTKNSNGPTDAHLQTQPPTPKNSQVSSDDEFWKLWRDSEDRWDANHENWLTVVFGRNLAEQVNKSPEPPQKRTACPTQSVTLAPLKSTSQPPLSPRGPPANLSRLQRRVDESPVAPNKHEFTSANASVEIANCRSMEPLTSVSMRKSAWQPRAQASINADLDDRARRVPTPPLGEVGWYEDGAHAGRVLSQVSTLPGFGEPQNWTRDPPMATEGSAPHSSSSLLSPLRKIGPQTAIKSEHLPTRTKNFSQTGSDFVQKLKLVTKLVDQPSSPALTDVDGRETLPCQGLLDDVVSSPVPGRATLASQGLPVVDAVPSPVLSAAGRQSLFCQGLLDDVDSSPVPGRATLVCQGVRAVDAVPCPVPSAAGRRNLFAQGLCVDDAASPSASNAQTCVFQGVDVDVPLVSGAVGDKTLFPQGSCGSPRRPQSLCSGSSCSCF